MEVAVKATELQRDASLQQSAQLETQVKELKEKIDEVERNLLSKTAEAADMTQQNEQHQQQIRDMERKAADIKSIHAETVAEKDQVCWYHLVCTVPYTLIHLPHYTHHYTYQ